MSAMSAMLHRHVLDDDLLLTFADDLRARGKFRADVIAQTASFIVV